MNTSWLEEFRFDPDSAIADLFSGRVGAGSSFRLDLPELLYQAFPAHLADERRLLDEALLNWLLDMRSGHPEHVQKLGVSVYAKRLVDALATLQLIDLPNSRNHIRSNLDAWLRWLSPLRLAPERDPALECWRLISQDQPGDGNAAAWLRLAGDPRPEYFGVAWVGLQQLPNNGDARRNQRLMAHAALRHAAVTSHGDIGTARKSWNRRFAALRGLFPRGPRHWDHVLNDVAQTIINVETGFVRDLAIELHPAPSKHQGKNQQSLEQPDTKVQFDRLEMDMQRDPPSDGLPRRLLDLSSQNLAFAEATGESYYFVRTLNKLGSELLRVAKWEEGELIELGHFVEHALAWEPAEPYVWGLWSEWFGACDNQSAREWALREMVRLFPSNEYCRVELARLLMERGADHWNEAVHWLRQAVERNPDKAHSHVELGRVLDLLGEDTEANRLLDAVIAKDPFNEVARNVRDHLGSEKPRQLGHESRATSVAYNRSSLIEELERRGRLTGEFNGAQFWGNLPMPTPLIHEGAAKGDSLAGFYAQWLRLECAAQRPPHAWAWNACHHWQERSADGEWERLMTLYPEAATETKFLQLLVAMEGRRAFEEHPARDEEFSSNCSAPTHPAASFMRDLAGQVENMDTEQREEVALAVLASGAVGSLEFAGAIG